MVVRNLWEGGAIIKWIWQLDGCGVGDDLHCGVGLGSDS